MLRPSRALAAGRHLGEVLVDAVDGFFSDGCSQYAAAIAYRVLFSIAPLAIVLTSIAGVVLRDDARRAEVVNAIVGALPVDSGGSHDVDKAIVAVASPASLVGLVSIAAFAWTASGMMAALRAGLAAAMRSPGDRPIVRGKLVDLVLVMVAGLLVMLVVIGNALGSAAWDWATHSVSPHGIETGWLQAVVTRGIPLVLTTGIVMLLYRFVPARRLRSSDAIVGALVTSVLLLGLSLASARLYRSTLELSTIYGSLTTLFVFLYAVYLHACALLLGAEVAAAWGRWPMRAIEPQDQGTLARLVRRLAIAVRRPR
jgi:membrane protein